MEKIDKYDVINYLNEPITICQEPANCVVESGALESGGTLNFGFGEGKTIKVIGDNLGNLEGGEMSFTVQDLISVDTIIVGDNIYPINNPESTQTIIFKDIDENFKKVEVYHDFIITDIVIPQELKNEKDFAKVREGALRKGKIIRYIDIDGKKIKKEVEFEV